MIFCTPANLKTDTSALRLRATKDHRSRFSRSSVSTVRGPADWSVDPDSEPGRSAPIPAHTPGAASLRPPAGQLAAGCTLDTASGSSFLTSQG